MKIVKVPFESFTEFKTSLSEIEGIEALIYLFESEKVSINADLLIFYL